MFGRTPSKKNGIRVVSLALLAVAAMPATAIPIIDLGVAHGYSAFILGNVTAANDIEGRIAVGGNLYAKGASFNYRTPSSNTGPAIVVGGNITLLEGRIYNEAPHGRDSTLGQFRPYWDSALSGPNYHPSRDSFAVYGGANLGSSKNGLDIRAMKAVPSFTPIDFNAAAQQLNTTSQQLAALKATGTVSRANGGLTFTGQGQAFEVFNVNTASFQNLKLANVRSDATLIFNYHGSDTVTFSGGQFSHTIALPNGQKSEETWSPNILFNFANATGVQVNSWVGGSVLAPKAVVSAAGGGHLEGSLYARELSTVLEVGYSPMTSAVPEPGTWAMLLSGVGLVAWMARRRQQY